MFSNTDRAPQRQMELLDNNNPKKLRGVENPSHGQIVTFSTVYNL